MDIAPNVPTTNWKALKLDDANSADWAKAIGILESRIKDRFIAAVDFLLDTEKDIPAGKRRFGFAVLAIDCLLIETLGAFLDGLEDTDRKSEKVFCKFLTTRRSFSSDFSLALARQFYKEFRCGILHQAEIGGDSKVWSVGPLMRDMGGSVVVNRNEFHRLLVVEFEAYLVELRDPKNAGLRTNFRKKMDFISRS